MPTDERVQRIIKWRESFTLLPDSHFFELMRMYLGNIKTPFNKQKIVEDLGNFIRKPETKKTMISLLSENDVKILNGIHFINNTTQDKLAEFFEGEYSFPNLYERLLNLEERLLVYRYSDKSSSKPIIDINPMIEDELKPFFDLNFVLSKPKNIDTTQVSSNLLTPELIASFLNFIENEPGLCKNDGTLKKRALESLEKLFPKKEAVLKELLKAFINLSLIREDDDGFFVDYARVENFAVLPYLTQVLYLTVSASGRFSREWLIKQSELLYKAAISIPETGYSRRSIIRSSYISGLSEGDETDSAPKSRFSQILASARGETSENEDYSSGSIVGRLCETAELFGVLEKIGVEEEKTFKKATNEKTIVYEGIYKKGRVFYSENMYHDEGKVLSIDAGFNVTLMPGLSLKALIPLTQFMELKSFDTATVFEINRRSVMSAMDKGIDSKNILSCLEQRCLYEIPQNLKISLDDWNSSFSSATLYKGFILKVSKENIALTEKNPAIASHIREMLAPGIYLLSVKNDEEAKELIAQSGLDFIGKIKHEAAENSSIPFPRLNISSNAKVSLTVENSVSRDEELPTSKAQYKEARDSIINSLREYLDKMNLIPEQKEELLSRLNRKIIITPEQFRPDSVRLERVEASGIDYQGKVLIIEHAISSHGLVEIEYDEIIAISGEDGAKVESKTIVATPVSISKLSDDAEVTLLMEPFNNEIKLSVGRAKRVKRVRGDILD